MDTRELRDVARIVGYQSDADAETIRDAADRIDALEAKLKEYEGATVVEVEDKEYGICPLYNDAFCKCSIKPIDCIHWSKLKPSDCPIRRGVVVVKMKKE